MGEIVDVVAVRADDQLVEGVAAKAHTPTDDTERLLVAWVSEVRP